MKLKLLISLSLFTPVVLAAMDHDNMGHNKMDHKAMDHGKMAHLDMQSMPAMTAVGMPAQGAKANKVVHIILSDEQPMQFKKPVTIDANDVVQFVVMNTGTQNHEFAIGSEKELNTHHKMMLQMAGMEHDTSSSIIVPPKKARQFTWHFHGDKHVELACNIKGHQQHGKSLNLN